MSQNPAPGAVAGTGITFVKTSKYLDDFAFKQKYPYLDPLDYH